MTDLCGSVVAFFTGLKWTGLSRKRSLGSFSAQKKKLLQIFFQSEYFFYFSNKFLCYVSYSCSSANQVPKIPVGRTVPPMKWTQVCQDSPYTWESLHSSSYQTACKEPESKAISQHQPKKPREEKPKEEKLITGVYVHRY